MYVNSLFAFYSWIELGSPLVGESAPPAVRAVPVWTAAVRERAEQLLVEVLSFVRPDASNEPLGGGRQRVARELESARIIVPGAHDNHHHHNHPWERPKRRFVFLIWTASPHVHIQ